MITTKKVVFFKNVKIFFFLLFVVLLFFKPEFKSSLSDDNLILYILIFFIAIFLHFFSNRNKSNWCRSDVFFVIGFTIVHFQWPIMFSFSGIIPANITRVWVDPLYVNFGTWLSAIGGVSWLIGYSCLQKRRKSCQFKSVMNYEKLIWFGVVLFVLLLLTAGNDFLSGGVYKGSGGKSTGEGVAAYIQLLFSNIILILTAVVILNKRNRYQGNLLKWILSLDKRYLLLACTYVLVFLSIGDRGGAIEVILTFLILIGSIIRPIKLKELAVIVVFGALILTLIGIGRGVDSNNSSLSSGLRSSNVTSFYDLTTELANSNRTLYMSLSNVPEKHDFFYGKLWLGNIMSPIPFLQSLYLQLTGDNSYEMGSAGYITYLTLGANPTSGEGTSLIADIYLNVGVLGVVIFMFLFGLFFKNVDNNFLGQRSFQWIIIAAIIAGSSFYFGRSGLFVAFRSLIWSFPIIYLLVSKRRFKL